MSRSFPIPVRSAHLVATTRPPPPPPGLHTMKLDLSSTCNIACDYCFVDEGHALPGPKLMPVSIINSAIAWFSGQNKNESSVVVLFGGEPLLNKNGIASACAAVGSLRKAGQDIRLQLITNAILADEEICSHLAYAEATVMVSIDGGECEHDTHRRDHKGNATYSRVVDGLRNLQARIPPSRLWVRATMAEGKSQVHYFDRIVDLGVRQISLGYVDDAPPIGMSANDYCLEIDNLMHRVAQVARSGIFVRLHPISTYLSLLYGEIGRGETWPRYDCGAATRIISVTPDGQIYPCEHAVLARNRHDWKIGSVWEGIHEAAVSKFLNQTARIHQGCRSCGTANMCDQGCRVDSTMDETRDQCHGAKSYLYALWERARFWYKKWANENPSLLMRMVDERTYESIRQL